MIKTILLADDDKDDRFFFELVISEAANGLYLTMVPDGEQLMLWLKQHVNQLPDIVFLDLNMPRKNGFVCLEEIRKSEQLKDAFVVIYSTSTNPKDVSDSYDRGANLFINKPNGYNDLKVIIKKVLDLDLTAYPPRGDADKFVLMPQEDKW